MSARRASVTALAGVLGAVGLMLLLVTWAATIGPDEVVRGEGNPPTYETLPTSETAEPRRADQRQGGRRGSGDQDLLLTIVVDRGAVLAAVVMLAVVLSVLRWLLTRDWRRQRREPDPRRSRSTRSTRRPCSPDAWSPDAATPAGRCWPTGTPRNAIVACWHPFEEQAGAGGGPATDVGDLLGVHPAGARPARRPTARRCRAWPSSTATPATPTHEITEADRAAAEVALDVVHRSLGARSVAAGSRRERRGFWWRWLAATAVVFGVVLGAAARRSTSTRDRARCCCWSPS